MSAVANLLTSSNAQATDLVGEWMPGILVRQGRSVNFGSVLLGFFAKLKAEREKLALLKPSFFSVTYGAGGSTRERSFATVREIAEEGHAAAPHLS